MSRVRGAPPHPRGALRAPAALPTGAEKVAAVDAMFDAIAPGYDVTNRVISLGLDVSWRRRTVLSLGLPPESLVLDLACGTGDLCQELARHGLTAIGVDRSAGMLQAAQTRTASGRSSPPDTAAGSGRPSPPATDAGTGPLPSDAFPGGASFPRSPAAPLVRGDGLALPFQAGALDGIVCGFALRNFAALPPALAECARVLRPGGRMAMLEVDAPSQPLLRFGHRIWFGKVVPFVGGLVAARSGAPRARASAAYRYLPASVAYLPTAPELLALISAAGFTAVEREALSGGIAQLLTGTRS